MANLRKLQGEPCMCVVIPTGVQKERQFVVICIGLVAKKREFVDAKQVAKRS